jgi:hypothetical protein
VLRFAVKVGLVILGGVTLMLLLSPTAEARVTVQPVDYRGWSGSYRLSNGTAEVVVVPAVGRILRYGFIGGPNLIWEDPALSGKPADRKTFPRFGGNKAWPWPQHEWPRYIGHEWPPPPAADQAAFTATPVGKDTVRMISPLVVGFGARLVREITLAPTGSQVTITTRLEHVDSPGPVKTIAAWSITPVASPDTLLVRLTSNSTLPARYKPLGSFDPFARVTDENGLLRVVRQSDKSSKIGIDGDAFAVAYGDTLWLLRDRTRETGAAYVAGERVQIYANADSAEDTAHGLPPYMELEFTSPRKGLSRGGDTVTLTEVWELKKLPRDPEKRSAFIKESLKSETSLP